VKTVIIANGTTDKLILVPETDIEKAFMMALGKVEAQATIMRGQYTPIGEQAPQTAAIVTIPHSTDGQA
jgi:hypothetical protein